MKVTFTPTRVVGQKSNPNFKSRVVYEKSESPLASDVKDFIDHFENACPKKDKYSGRDADDYSYGHYKVRKGDSGESARTYFVEPNSYWASLPKFVIKESRPLRYKTRLEGDYGDLSYEYDMAKTAHNIQNARVQNPIAYVKTANGSKFMLSETLPDIAPMGSSTAYVLDAISGPKINETYLRSALDTLAKFDRYNIFHPDLTRSNVQINTNDKSANFLDFQWSQVLTPWKDYSNITTFTFEPNEKINNIAPFEANVIADYLVGEKGLGAATDNTDINALRNVLREYLRVRADYAPRTSAFSTSVFRNPSDDVLDAELLRLALLRNHRLQFLYTDDNIEKPRNMMKLVGYSALANHAAKQLAEFQPRFSPRNRQEQEYFDYMRKYGQYWHGKTKNWYRNTADYLRKLAQGYETAPGRFYENLFMPAGLDTNQSHFELLNKDSDAYKTWQIAKKRKHLPMSVCDVELQLKDIKNLDYSEFQASVNDLYD